MIKRVWIVGAHTPLGRAISVFFQAAGVSVAESRTDFDPADPVVLDAFTAREGPFSQIFYCGMPLEPELAQPLALPFAQPLALLRVAKKQHARFIAIGSACVFSGSLASRDYTEKSPAVPVVALGRIQLETERVILSADPWAIVLRTGWLYGAPPAPPAPLAAPTEADTLIESILRAGAKGGSGLVQVPDDEIVSPTFGESLARVVFDMTLAERIPPEVVGEDGQVYPGVPSSYHPTPGGLYHYADWGRATLPEFAAEVVRLALDHKLIDRPVEIVAQPASAFPGRAVRPLHQHLSAQKLAHSMVLFQHPWQDCLDEYLTKKSQKLPVPTCLSGCTGV